MIDSESDYFLTEESRMIIMASESARENEERNGIKSAENVIESRENRRRLQPR